MIRIRLYPSLARALVIILEIAAFLALSVRIGRNYLADRAADGVSPEELTRAIHLDPGNASNHLRLARLALYSISNANPELAMEHLLRASTVSPRNVQVWLELSAASGFQGNNEQAEFFLRRADKMAPRIPAIQWVVGNFYLLQGNNEEAFKHFRVTLDGTHRYDRILFRTAWKASGDGAQILKDLIPSQVNTEFAYLYYLIDEDKFSEALEVWKRIAASPGEFEGARAARFLDRLLGARMPSEAAQVWNDLHNKRLIPPTAQPTEQNLIVNGNFEDEFFSAGFNWRVAKTEGAATMADGGTSRSPSHSYRVAFDGTKNVNYGHLFELVRVAPNRKYRLQGYIRTEGITTDSGVFIRVGDFYDRSQLLGYSENFTGTTPSWNQVTLEFRTGSATEVLMVALARLPSKKLDNLISGTAWLDDVSLTPIP